MEITIAGQTWTFLGGILLGAVLGICYDLFRVARIIISHPPALVAVEDILFFGICTVGTFLYLLGAGYGEIRMFVLVGELVGFSLYHCTLGALAVRLVQAILNILRRIFSLLWRLLLAPVLRLAGWIIRPVSKVVKNLANYAKSHGKNSRFPLQRRYNLLYNLKEQLWRKRQKKNEECRSGLKDEKRWKQKDEPCG